MPARRTRVDRPEPFDFTSTLDRVCRDVARRLKEFRHVDMDRVAVTFAQARRRVSWGMQAKLTPLRFEGGAAVKTDRRGSWTIPKLYDGPHEQLYILTFYLPRFLERPPVDRLVTVLHELHHISPEFNGDIRRFPGRCYAHSHSQAEYDAEMTALAAKYLAARPPRYAVRLLNSSYADLVRRHGAVVGLKLPVPRLVKVP